MATNLHGVCDLFLLRHGAQIPGRGGSCWSSPRLTSVHTHSQRSLQHRLLAGLVLPSSHHGGPALLASTSLGLLTGSLLLHGDPESERQLWVVVRVDAELEAATAGSGRPHPVLALEDGAGDQGVTEVRAGGDGHQVGPGPLLTIDCRDKLVEDISIGAVLPEVDDVYVDLDYISPLLTVPAQH